MSTSMHGPIVLALILKPFRLVNRKGINVAAKRHHRAAAANAAHHASLRKGIAVLYSQVIQVLPNPEGATKE
jgi:hypothetical protein